MCVLSATRIIEGEIAPGFFVPQSKKGKGTQQKRSPQIPRDHERPLDECTSHNLIHANSLTSQLNNTDQSFVVTTSPLHTANLDSIEPAPCLPTTHHLPEASRHHSIASHQISSSHQPNLRTQPQSSNYDILLHNKYTYTADLLKLNASRAMVLHRLPETCNAITTPLVHRNWAAALQEHPDREFVSYILEGISQGFKLGVDYANNSFKSAKANMRSALTNPGPVNEYLTKELEANRVVPVPSEQAKGVHVSRFGVIPKSGQPGKWRLILDLSSPEGFSVNDGIDPKLCSLSFATVDEAVSQILKRGTNSLLAKIDIEHAYRNIPVHIDDRPLLGMEWNSTIFVDTVLPFGLRSAPKIFSSIADALEWILLKKGVSFSLHYLDDFLTVGEADSDQCKRNLELICSICKFLGIPLKIQKIEGPSMCLIFLGIELDTVRLEMRLPVERIAHLKDLLRSWVGKKHCQKRELLSLIGKLSHACKVVVAGRLFLRRMIDTAKTARRLCHWIHLNSDFHSDLEWWLVFLDYWNGRSMMEVHSAFRPDVTLWTDASGAWGCGAAWEHRWIQCPWNGIWQSESIATKELLPIVLAVAVWGPHWQSKHLLVRCDNMAVVQVINAQNCRDPSLLHLMRGLHFFSALYDIQLKAQHIAGIQNTIADAISRNFLQILHRENPSINKTPETIPSSIWELLVTQRPDWCSAAWKSLLRTSLGTAWLQAPRELMERLKLNMATSVVSSTQSPF